jgi:hypothetical protein
VHRARGGVGDAGQLGRHGQLQLDGRRPRRPPRPARHFDRLSAALKEVIDARVWGGIHFRTADVQGTVIGKKVAHWLDTHYFKAID